MQTHVATVYISVLLVVSVLVHCQFLYMSISLHSPLNASHYALVTGSHPIFTQDEDSHSPLIRHPGAL
jgi:hypothetical protein